MNWDAVIIWPVIAFILYLFYIFFFYKDPYGWQKISEDKFPNWAWRWIKRRYEIPFDGDVYVKGKTYRYKVEMRIHGQGDEEVRYYRKKRHTFRKLKKEQKEQKKKKHKKKRKKK